MKNLRVARRYAQALMESADAAKTVDATGRDLASIAAVLAGSRELRLLAASPVVRPVRKEAVFRELFGARVGKGTMQFLALVIARQREAHLGEIAEQFALLRDAKQGVVGVDVASAVALSAPQQEELTRALGRATGKTVRLRLTVDPAIRGGLVVRVGDTVLDASVRRQLELLKARFVQGGPSTN
ncbi:MAG TPA: ATP synthase F1 subunit delta [Bacteroidota bacterium]|nr:ATP synthase F1 subunit delta [Bacteroidota bacterium]